MSFSFRYYISQGGGCCDCGDTGAILQKGFCKYHEGYQAIDPKSVLLKIPQKVQENITILLTGSVYHLISMIEEKETHNIINKSDSIKILTEGFLNFIMKLCEKSIAFVFLVTKVLMERFRELLNTEELKLKHVCSNVEFIELGEPRACECTLLELLLRFSSRIDNATQGMCSMEKVFCKLFANLEFKKYFAIKFSKMFNFILLTKEINNTTKQPFDQISLSSLRGLYYQFVGEELSDLWFGTGLNLYLDKIKEFFHLLCDSDFINAFDGISYLSRMLSFQMENKEVMQNKIMKEEFIERFLTSICYEEGDEKGNNRKDDPGQQIEITRAESNYLGIFSSFFHFIPASDAESKVIEIITVFLPTVSRYLEKAQEGKYKTHTWFFLHMVPVKALIIMLSHLLKALGGNIDLFEKQLRLLLQKTIGEEKLKKIFKLHGKMFLKGYFLSREMDEERRNNRYLMDALVLKWIQIYYKAPEAGLFDIDLFGYQLGLALNFTNNDWILNKMKKYFLNEDFTTIFSPDALTNRKKFSYALEFLLITNSDTFSSLNVTLRSEVKREEEIYYDTYLEKELNYLASQIFYFNDSNLEFPSIANLISDNFLHYNISFDKIIPNVATLDLNKKDFRLKPECKSVCDPSIWIRTPFETRQEAINTIKMLAQKDKTIDPVLGNQNQEIYTPQPLNRKLLENLANSEIFKYFRFEILGDDHYKALESENTLKYLFKLVFLAMSHIINKQSATKKQKILEEISLSKMINDLRKKNILDEEYLLCIKKFKKMISDAKGEAKAGDEMEVEEMKDETENLNEMKLKNQIRQNEIRNEFIKKQREFIEKTVELKLYQEEEINKTEKEDAPCLCCHKSNNDPNTILGITAFLNYDTLGSFYNSKRNTAIKLENIITSCGHHIHMECQTKIMLNQRLDLFFTNQDNQNEYLCPGCKYLSNIIVPIVNSFMKPIDFNAIVPECECKSLELYKFLLNASEAFWKSEKSLDEKLTSLIPAVNEFFNRVSIVLILKKDVINSEQTRFQTVFNCISKESEFCFTEGHSNFMEKKKPFLINNLYNINVLHILSSNSAQKLEIRNQLLFSFENNLNGLIEINMIEGCDSILNRQDEYFIGAFWAAAFLFCEDPILMSKAIKHILKVFLSKIALIYAFLILKTSNWKKIFSITSTNNKQALEIIGFIYPYLSLAIGLMISLFQFTEKEINFFKDEDGDEAKIYDHFCKLFFGVEAGNSSLELLFAHEISLKKYWLSKLRNIFTSKNEDSIIISGKKKSRSWSKKTRIVPSRSISQTLDFHKLNSELKKNPCIKFEIIPLGNNYHEFAKLHLYKKCELCKYYPQIEMQHLFVCIICGSVMCGECNDRFLKNIYKHTSNLHNGCAIWINLETAEVIQIFEEKVSTHGTLFYNELGQGYKKFDDKQYTSNWDKYLLEKKKAKDLLEIVYKRRIPQEVSYQSGNNHDMNILFFLRNLFGDY